MGGVQHSAVYSSDYIYAEFGLKYRICAVSFLGGSLFGALCVVFCFVAVACLFLPGKVCYMPGVVLFDLCRQRVVIVVFLSQLSQLLV